MMQYTKNPEEILANYLAGQGMKITNQRRVIVRYFFDHTGEHMSAEEMYQRMRKTDPSIGQATVYRTLKLLREAGLARELRFADDVTRYEPKTDAPHHDHLICERCGKTVPVVDEEIERLQTKLAESHGFTFTSHRMYLYGVCPECTAKEKK